MSERPATHFGLEELKRKPAPVKETHQWLAHNSWNVRGTWRVRECKQECEHGLLLLLACLYKCSV